MSDSKPAVSLSNLGLLAAAWLAGAGMRAQEPAADGPATEDVAAERAVPQVLHLASGGFVRARARRAVDEQGAPVWEVEDGRGWRRIPAAGVLRAERERDLLAQRKRLLSEAERDEPFHRVAIADWCLREGLVPEALEELDRVLALDPDQPQALSLCGSAELALPPIPSGPDGPDDEALGAWLARAARGGPAYRELAAQRLGEAGVGAAGFGVQRLEAELVDPDAARRSFAALALRRLAPGAAVRELVSRSILDRSESVRTSASLALKAAGDEGLILPAVKALSSSSAAVRRNAIQSLGTMGYPAAAEPLMSHLGALARPSATSAASGGSRAPHSHIFVGRQFAYISDYDVEVAQNSAIADPIINVMQEGVVLDAAVLGVTEYVVQTERAETRRSLASLTGASPGHTTAAWERWWNENGQDWLARASAPKPTSPSGPGR